ncbi:O-antigen polymerase [Marinivivus vitaminiproducens]|uniref:O-antigen polymerase n=1 Tax=Marinivivus vitaminiproducens TaxID=3035935 RepID=UPI0027A763EF|nr:O-antigen ligase [Geminicoccaceae bacterium SCSIO 64248]
MIYLLILFPLLLSLITIAIGLRNGLLSPMSLFGIHMMLGVAFRAYFVEGSGVSLDTFLDVLTRTVSVDTDAIMFELMLAQTCVLLGYLGFPNWLSYRSATVVGNQFALVRGGYAVRVVALTIFLASWAIYLIFMMKEFGSIQAAFLSMQKRALLYDSDVAMTRKLVFVAAAAMAAYTYAVAHDIRYLRGLSVVIWAGLLAFHVGAMFMTGSRGATLTHLMLFAFVFWVGSGRRTFRLGPSAIGLASVLAPVVGSIVLIGMASRIAGQDHIPFTQALGVALERGPQILSATFPIFDLYAAARYFADANGHDFGMQYLNYITRFIPRDLWGDKPMTLGIQMRLFYYNDTLSGVPPTVFGEYYIAFGILGIVAGSIMFGFILSVLTSMQRMLYARPEYGAVYLFLLISITFGVVKSGFENSLFNFLYFAVSLLAVRLLCAKLGGLIGGRKRTRQEPAISHTDMSLGKPSDVPYR